MGAATAAIEQGTRQAEWFASWFDSPHYHELYANRNDAEAARFIDALIRRLRPAARSSALDLGCGAGRHAHRLAANGLDVTGLDLSANSIGAARAFERRGLRFRLHDMRMPFGRRAFDYVFNLFTSFGYFETTDEHLAVIRNITDALKPGGHIVLDYLNVRYADRRMTPEEIRRSAAATYYVTRWTDPHHFYKRITVADWRRGEMMSHVERVARFTLDDFRAMFASCGLQIVNVFGDYWLNPYDEAGSPRLVIVARRCGAAKWSAMVRHGHDVLPDGRHRFCGRRGGAPARLGATSRARAGARSREGAGSGDARRRAPSR